MENGGGDALAHSQLARLYKLGLLQQDPGEVENDPHAFLNRLPPATARFASQEEHQDQRMSSFQSSGDHSSDSMDQSPFTLVRPYPLRSMMEMTRPPPRFNVANRAPLSPMSLASRPTLPPRFDATLPLYTPPVRDPRHPKAWKLNKKCFMTWRRCVEAKWMREKAVAIGTRSLKRRALKRWEDAVYKMRLNNARCRQLTSWKAQRALRSWSQWAALHGRVTWFLTAQGRSHALVNRLRRERTWLRWKRFVQMSRKQRKKNEKALQWRWQRCVQQAWIRWRVQAFCGRRRRRLYRAFMTAVRVALDGRQYRWALAMELYGSHAQDRLRRLFKRWRVYNSVRQREHQRVWQVGMIMTRGKFFTIWHATMQQTRQIARLRHRVQRRVWKDHLRAWWATTRANRLGRVSTLWHPEAICARYLHVWKCWTHDKRRFRFAASVLHKKQLKHALRVMRTWTGEHARVSRLHKAANAITRRRILTHVWENGLLAFHFAHRQEKQLVIQVHKMSLAKAMQRWRFKWLLRHEWRFKKQQARKLAFQTVVKSVWDGWCRHTHMRRCHKEQILRAAQYDHHRLISRGLVTLSEAVDRKSEWTRACRQIRVRQRETWKRRVLTAWRAHTRKSRLLNDNLTVFVSRPMHARSIWNPLRRRWRRWVAFVRLETQTRTRVRHVQQRWQEKVFNAWKKRSFIMAKTRERINRKEQRLLLASLSTWKLKVEGGSKKRSKRLLAATFHAHKFRLKLLREWSRLAVLRRRIQKRGDEVRSIQCQRGRLVWFSKWRRSFMLQRGIRALEQRRRYAWFQFCWDAWRHDHHTATKMKKKLSYYHRVFGRHPSTSLLKRLWCRWKQWTGWRLAAKQFQYRVELRQAGVCLAAWKTFHLAKRILRRWHRFSLIAGATHSDLGKRCRLLREKRHKRRTLGAFRAWKNVSKARQRRYEAFLDAKQQILDEILRGFAMRVKYRRCRLRQWFQRWRRRQLESVYLAMNLHRMKTLRSAFLGWWRLVVHGKQERLLEDARRSMGLLSINKTKQAFGGREGAGTKRVAFSGSRSVKATPARMVDSLPVRRSYSLPSQRLPPKQSLTAQASRDQRAEVSRRAQEGEEKYRDAQVARTSSSTKNHNQPSEQTRAQRTSAPLKELPLFDDETELVTIKPMTESRISTTQRSPVMIGESDDAFTLESIASMNPYSPPNEPRKIPRSSLDNRILPPIEKQQMSTSANSLQATRRNNMSEPSLFSPRQSLASRALPTSRRNDKPTEKPSAQRKRPDKSSKDLIQLLEIPQQESQRSASTFRSVLRGMHTDSEAQDAHEVDVQDVVRRILDYYVVKSRYAVAVHAHQPQVWLQIWGFCLLRDLGLFENGHFMSATERAIEHVTSGSINHEPRIALQLLLEEFIQAHPHRKSSKLDDPLSWLVKRHLARRCGQAALQQSNSTHMRPLWVRHELPECVVVSLPKLTKCFIKYQKPIEQFFLWRPENSGVLPSKTDCRMDIGTLILLMKHCHVHPQLFDRRELEEAVGCAGVSSDRGMNMPQFVEALVRCSLRLQWMDDHSHEGSNAARFPDLVVAIKFLMLVFTMEGRGSMLTKRSQDLDVLMSFLQKQQHETSAEKLRRFQGLLRAEPPRVHEEAQRQRAVGRSTNAFRSFMGTRPEAYEARETSAYPQPFSGYTEPARRAQRHQEIGDSRGPRSQREEYERKTSHQNCAGLERPQERAVSEPREAQREDHETRSYLDGTIGREDRRESRQQDSHQTSRQDREQHDSQEDISHEEAKALSITQSTGRSGEHATFTTSQAMQTSHSSDERKSDFPGSGLQQPMDREAFLNEILSSITDVELLLQQADARRGSCRPMTLDTTADILVELSSEPFSVAYPERHTLLTTGQLPTSALDDDVTGITEDIRVGDPVLDYLTFADRFSESQDWESHLTIADVAEHGIHAAFPSSMHVLGQIHTVELDDLTHPQPATAHLRANGNEEADSRSHFLSWSSEREWLDALHGTGDEVSR